MHAYELRIRGLDDEIARAAAGWELYEAESIGGVDETEAGLRAPRRDSQSLLHGRRRRSHPG